MVLPGPVELNWKNELRSQSCSIAQREPGSRRRSQKSWVVGWERELRLWVWWRRPTLRRLRVMRDIIATVISCSSWAAMFLVPSGAPMIMMVRTRVTETMTL